MSLLERDGSLAVLADATDAAASGSGQVVLVAGEAGIGKTALVSHFVHGREAAHRAMWGMCDDLAIARPFGAIRDLAGDVSDRLHHALASSTDPIEIRAALLAELGAPPAPTILVVEDVHWADDASLDTLTVVGRRIDRLPAVLVLTYRPGEAPPGHRLHPTLAALSGAATHRIELPPLSRRAVAALAGDRADADRVYDVTGGNPFYVTELLAEGSTELPGSIVDAVGGRIAHLGDRERWLVELVSVIPTRAPTPLLDDVMPDWSAAAETPERLGLIRVEPRQVRYRHELARRAVEAHVASARRRELHAAVLAGLLREATDPAGIVYHAEAAGDVDVVASHAHRAARHATALASNREAHAHLKRAVDFADRVPLPDRAALFEELAVAAYTADHLDESFPAIEQAIAIHRSNGDARGVGRCTRSLSRFHWYAGDGRAAMEASERAVEVLEPLGASAELAQAYSTRSQLAMLAGDADATLFWGERAVDLACQVGDEATRAHALVNIGLTRLFEDIDDTATILGAHALASAAGDHHEAVRSLIGLAYTHLLWARPQEATLHTERGIEYAEQHQVDTLLSYLNTMMAWLLARGGDWSTADRLARREIEHGRTVAQLLAKIVLAEIAIRRGDPDAVERLSDVAAQAELTGELQRIGPVVELELEHALLIGEPLPRARIVHVLDRCGASPTDDNARRLAAWGRVADVAVPDPLSLPGPFAAMREGDWAAAAAAFASIGWHYDSALMLSLLDDEGALLNAIEIARRLGAAPLEGRVARRMRQLGFRVPRRRRAAVNAAGLTDRQVEVLDLVAGGLADAEIAERLYISRRTAEHHVSAIITKLGVHTRREAVARAIELGVLSRP